MVIWIGADWDSEKCVVEADSGAEVLKASVLRRPEEVKAFVERLGAGTKVVGIEAGDPLWATLWEQAGAEVFVFDPKKAKRYAQSLCSSNASDDKRSATTLREQVASEAHRSKANQPLPRELRGLDRMTTLLDTLSREATRESNRLGALLRQVHPALRPVLGDLDSVSVIRLIQAVPTPGTWRELSEDERTKVLKGLRTKRRVQVEKVIGEVWTVFNKCEERAARLQVRQVANLLQASLDAKKQAEAELEDFIAEDQVATTVTSVSGIGRFLGAGAAVALGGTDGDRDRMALRTGAAPVTSRSGARGDRQPAVRMRRSSGSIMRKVGYLIAVQLVVRHRWAKAQFAFYRSKGIRSAGAYRRISRSFGRVLAALVRNQVPFDEERYVKALKGKGVVWAAEL